MGSYSFGSNLPTGFPRAFEDSARLRQDDLVQVGRKALTERRHPRLRKQLPRDLRSRKLDLLDPSGSRVFRILFLRPDLHKLVDPGI
jgi:hypothetical protein